MNRCVYTLVLRLLAPLIWLWMARRAKRAGGDWQIFSPGRFGHDPAHQKSPAAGSPENRNGHDGRPAAQHTGQRGPVWVHAVSLGETRAAQPLIDGLLARGLPVLLTHTTATGKAEGARLFASAISAGQLRQRWLPYDFPGSVARFFAAYLPRAGILIEREIWPNLLAGARQRGVPMALVSARFSDSSLRQARRMGGVLKEALAGLDLVLAQTDADAQRLAQAGARQPRNTGNLKFDVRLPEALVQSGAAWRLALGRQVLAIASTREGEEARFIGLIGQAESEAADAPLYLIIPRHPQRFSEVADALTQAQLAYARRSLADNRPVDPDLQVFLGDTLGEMPFFYGASDVAIIGGSFAKLGGQNLIEACAAGVPVIVGPHTFNFAQAAEDAIAAGAALRCADASAAMKAAHDLLADPARRAAMAEGGRLWTAQHRGATERILAALDTYMQP